MKVLLINGSPREHGCTYTALSEVAAAIGGRGIETEIYHIGSQPVAGCIACRACKSTGRCVFSDGVNKLLDRIHEFDGFVFGSPVYYASAAGQITSFLDRLFYAGSGELSGKPGASIVSCRRAGSTAALDRLNKYFLINCMPMVASRYWNMVHGNTPDEVRQDTEGMQVMRALGENMAWLLESIEAGKKAGVPAPQYEDRVMTNFIR